jgi:hypothetical protein
MDSSFYFNHCLEADLYDASFISFIINKQIYKTASIISFIICRFIRLLLLFHS